MAKTIILKNTTGSPIMFGNHTIPASPGQRDVSFKLARDFRDNPTILTAITNGNLVVNNGTSDLSAVNGLIWVQYEVADALYDIETRTGTGYISLNGGTNVSAVRSISGTTNQIGVTNSDGSAGNTTISIAPNPVLSGTGSITMPVGTTAQRPVSPTAGMFRFNTTTGGLEFYDGTQWTGVGATGGLQGTTSAFHYLTGGKPGGGSYLGTTSNHVFSDAAQYVIPFASRLRAMTYSNYESNTTPVINVMRSAAGAGVNDTSILSWTPALCRVAYRTDLDIALSAGDKVAVHMAKGLNTEPDRPVVSLYIQVGVPTSVGSTVENFAGNFVF